MFEQLTKLKTSLGWIAWPLFVIYFPVFFLWVGTSVFLWGLHRMIFGDRPPERQSRTANVAADIILYVQFAVAAGGAIVWTILILRAL